MVKRPAFVDCYGDLAQRLTSEMLELCSGTEVFRSEPQTENELIARLEGRRHALVYMGYLSERVLRACPELRTVAYLSSGLATHADLDVANQLGIKIEGVWNYADQAVAEHAITLALAALKRITESDRRVRKGQWGLLRTGEFAGRTFGVIGFGGIGRRTARMAAALGADVIGWSRSGVPDGCGAENRPLPEVLKRSDILSLHLTLTPETKGFLDSKAFASMKPGAILVNTARAALVEEQALLDALQSGRLSHCALDVFHHEPPDPESQMLALENVTLTPHSAWYTGDSIDRLLVAGLTLLRRHVEASG